MNLEQTVSSLYIFNLMLFIAGIGLLTYKGLFYRNVVEKKKALIISVCTMVALAVLAFVSFESIKGFVEAAKFASLLVFVGGLALNDSTVQSAHKKFSDKKYQDAIELYEKAIARYPKNASLYQFCGHAYLQLEQFDKAIDVAERCLKLLPDYEPVAVLKLHALLKMQRYQEILDASASMTTKYPDTEQMYLYRAEALQRLYKYELAIAELDKMKKPDIMAKMERIQLEIKLNRRERAIADFHLLMQNLKDKYPKEQMAHLLTFSSFIRMKEGKYETAIQEQTNAIDLDPNYLYAYVNRGFCHVLLGKFDLAQNDLEKAKFVCKSDFEKLIIETIEAAYLWKSGNLPGALKLLEDLQERSKDSADILTMLGLMQMLSEKDEVARESLSKAIEIDPNHADAYYYRYKLLEKLGLNELAQVDKARIEEWNHRPYFELT